MASAGSSSSAAFVAPCLPVATSVRPSTEAATCRANKLGYLASATFDASVRPNRSFFAGDKVFNVTAAKNGIETETRMALTKVEKDEIVAGLKENLGSAAAVLTFSFKGITHRELEKLRDSLPEGTKLQVVKNTLMKVAVDAVPEYKPLEEALKGQNGFFLVKEDVQGTIKAYRAFNKEAGRPKDEFLISGGVMEGKLLTSDEVVRIETMPSKLESIARIAGAIKAVPTKLAKGVNEVPSKLARSLKQVSEGKGTNQEGGADA